MKKTLIMLLLTHFAICSSFGQSGQIFDNLSIKSEILNCERNYSVYLPPDYNTSQRSYAVLYLLHGAYEDHTGWVQHGEVLYIADKAIREGKCTPMIIVMPDAETVRRGYFNQLDGNWQYEDFFFKEFIPYIESKYRIRGSKTYRAVAGLSMGGGGTFMYALHHPEMFSSACPLSAATGELTFDSFKERYAEESKKYSESVLKDYYEKHNALSLIANTPKEKISSVRWYIDCGDDDFLYEGNCLVHIAMRKKEIPHEFRVRDGAHRWPYWREALPEVLEFVSMDFHQY